MQKRRNGSMLGKIALAGTMILAAAGTIFAGTPKELLQLNLTDADYAKMSEKERQELQFKLNFREYPRAIVDKELVSFDDLRSETARAELALRREAKSSEEFIQKYRQLTLETLSHFTNMYLMVGEFEMSGMTFPEDMIDARVNDYIEQNFGGDRGKYLEFLRKNGRNPLSERRRIKNSLIEQNANWQISQTLPDDVSPMDVQRMYLRQLENLKHPAGVEFAQIVIYAGASEGESAVGNAAKMLAERLKKNPDDFAGTAKLHSRDDFRGNGGYVGWRAEEDLSDAVIEALAKIEPGQVSDLLELTDGSGRKMFFIFKLLNRRAEGTPDINEVRAQIENSLRGVEMEKARQEHLQSLREQFFVEWF